MPKFPISKLAQYAIRNPFTAAASVFAPIFAKNEDRGYFRTALITTPIVFAAGTTVPKLFGGVRDLGNAVLETRNVLQKAEKWTRFEQPNFHTMDALFKDSTVSQNTIERQLSSYLVSERRSRDFLKEQNQLSKYFNRRLVKTNDLISKAEMGNEKALARLAEIETLHATKGRLITNAMHVARRSSLTPLEWASEPSGVAPFVAGGELNSWMASTFEAYKGRPEFIRTLRNRLRGINKLSYRGTIEKSEGSVPLSTFNSTLQFVPEDELDMLPAGDKASLLLKEQAPEAYGYLQKAKERGNVGRIDIEWADAVVGGDTGRILNVKINRTGNVKPLVIPIVDPITGQVRSNANAIGVGRHVIGPDGKSYRVDEWVSKMLAEQSHFTNEELEQDIAANAYWAAADPMDDRIISSMEGALDMSPQAIKLRSLGASVTKQKLFDIGEDHPVSFYDYEFGAKHEVKFVRQLLNENRFILMGSESGKGRFQLRQASTLSPMGITGAAKQDPTWRSVTKAVNLSAPGGLPSEAVPNWRSTSWEGLTGSSELNRAQFTIASINPQDRAILEQTHPEFGRMGETGWVINENFADKFKVSSVSKYNLDELGVKAGDTLSTESVMGFNNGERVTPRFKGVVQDVSRDSDGFVVNVKHELGMQGAKLDIAGVKGMVPVTPTNEHFQQMRQAVNDLYSRTGRSDFIPATVNTFAPAEYFAEKIEPVQGYLGIGSELTSRLRSAGREDLTTEYLQKMQAEGVSYNGALIDTVTTPLSDKDASAKLLRLSEISEEFFTKAGDALKIAGGYHDPVLDAFVKYGKDLGNFMLKNQLPASGYSWDHSLINAPSMASVGYDVETYMRLGGNIRGLKAIRNRLQTVSGGDPTQSLDFMKYVMGGDYNQEMGVTVPLKEAFQSFGSPTEATNRAGSIFDPSVAAYENNFRVDLGNGKFLPVPGTKAYGAEASMYDPGKYQSRSWQNTIRDIARDNTPERAAEVIEEYKKQFGAGKGSAIRPYEFDPMGVSGVLSIGAEGEDPFLAKISPEIAAEVRSQSLRKHLLEGGQAVGVIHRQPTNQLPYLRYQVDESLAGTRDIVTSERLARALMGDQDKDTVNALFFDAHIRMENNKAIVEKAANKMEREAAEEAVEAMAKGGKQHIQLEAWESVKGTSEVARFNTRFELSGLKARAEKFATGVKNRIGVAVNRTAGSAIGSYSNLLTEMTENMARNSVVMRDTSLSARLNAGLFDIRQFPISARKAHVGFDLERAMQSLDQLKRGMANQNTQAATDQLHSSLLTMTKTLLGEDDPAHQYWKTQGAEDLKAFVSGRSEQASLAAKLFTMNVDREAPLRVGAERIISEAFQDIEGTLGAIHGGRMADVSASKIGIMSEYLGNKGKQAVSSVTGKIGRIFAEHGTGMALGIGALAALGIALTSRTPAMATFSRVSSNRYRPEDRLGVADSIPGEPISGQMAPSRPPRTVTQAQPGVRTTVIAPMGNTSDLSVRMKATDQSRAAETSRLIAQIPGNGDTNVTINYRDRTKLASLRTREKIRGMLS